MRWRQKFHFPQWFDIVRSRRDTKSKLTISMDLKNQKSKLSFSIENILRDDFSTRPRKDVPTLIPSVNSSFAKWPNIPVYRLCAVRYNPMFVQVLPRWPYAGTKLNKARTEDQQPCQEQQTNIEADVGFSACETQEGEGWFSCLQSYYWKKNCHSL